MQQKKQQSSLIKKRNCFKVQIRRQNLQKTFKQLRHLNLIYNDLHIPQMIQALPFSLGDLYKLQQSKQSAFLMVITKRIIDHIYPLQLQIDDENWTYDDYRQSQRMLKLKNSCNILVYPNGPQNIEQLKLQFWLFGSLLKYQPIYSQKLLNRYFNVLFQHASQFNSIQLVFDLINILVSNDKLNWVPVHQLFFLIQWINKQYHVEKIPLSKIKMVQAILKAQIQIYCQISINNFQIIQRQPLIRKRVLFMCQNCSDILWNNMNVKSFLKLINKITFYSHKNYQNRQIEIEIQQAIKEKEEYYRFQKALIQGGILRYVFKNIFYGAQPKKKFLYLNLLINLLFYTGSSIIWGKNKYQPHKQLQQQIRDKKNDYKIFKLFSQVFLISIRLIQQFQLFQNMIQSQVDVIELIIYIFENISAKQQKIRDIAVQCIQFILEKSQTNTRIKFANRLLSSNCLSQQNDIDLKQKLQDILEQNII